MIDTEEQIREKLALNRRRIVKANHKFQRLTKKGLHVEAKRAREKWLDLHTTRDILRWFLASEGEHYEISIHFGAKTGSRSKSRRLRKS